MLQTKEHYFINSRAWVHVSSRHSHTCQHNWGHLCHLHTQDILDIFGQNAIVETVFIINFRELWSYTAIFCPNQYQRSLSFLEIYVSSYTQR